MADKLRLSLRPQPLLPWLILFLLSAFAWISVLQQSLSMYFLAQPMAGTMGLSVGPFVLFWTIMMVAMMFPSLAPTLAARYQRQCQRYGPGIIQILLFLPGYLLVWALFGVPVFWLAYLGNELVLHAPSLSIGLGIILLLAIGLYQMTPLEKHYLQRCNSSLCCDEALPEPQTLFSQLKEGVIHGLHCLGCCGGLMLVMEVVGLMNLPWMILLTIAIFLEKTWRHGVRFSFFVGFGLLIFAMLALAEPALLSGLYRPV